MNTQTRTDDPAEAWPLPSKSDPDAFEMAQSLGDILDLAGAGFALLDQQGQCLNRNATASRLPRSQSWLAHTQHEDPIAENPVELGQVLDRVTRQIYNRLAPRLDTATPSRRLGEGPFRLIALRSSGKGQPPLTALIFTSASTMPAVGILLGRLIRPH